MLIDLDLTSIPIMIRDVGTGKTHVFEVGTDCYGVTIRHKETGHNICFEIFDNRLRVLAYEADADEPSEVIDYRPTPLDATKD